MTLEQAISEASDKEYVACVVDNKEDFNKLVYMIKDRGGKVATSCGWKFEKAGHRRAFFYSPRKGNYGHYSLSGLQREAREGGYTLVMFEMQSVKARLHMAIFKLPKE